MKRVSSGSAKREALALIDKLLKELPGILTAACGAYAGVVEAGGLHNTESCKKEVNAWRLGLNQIGELA